MKAPREIVLTGLQDAVIVTGHRLTCDRKAILFFRSVLGATPIDDGWRCPLRRHSVASLTLRIHEWLEKEGYDSRPDELLSTALAVELERRRSFARTREAAAAVRSQVRSFDFSLVEQALVSFGWSEQRQLHEHQRQGVAHGLTAINAANFSVPGSGKTATVLAVAVSHLYAMTIDLIVVVGPLASFRPWESETAAAVGSRIRVRRIRGTSRHRGDLYGQTGRGDLLTLSYATVAADLPILLELFQSHRTMLVVDESHRIKRFTGGLWAPALLNLARRARVRIVLSGTPMPQSGRDLFTQLNVIWPDGQLTGTRDAFGSRVDTNFAGVLSEILPFVYRTPKAALGLAPPIIIRHEVGLSGIQAEIYELIARRLTKEIAEAESWQEKLAALRKARPIRLLQAAANPDLFNADDGHYEIPRLPQGNATLMDRLGTYAAREVPAKSEKALDLITDIASRKEKVVCWSNFVPNLDSFARLVRSRLGIVCFQIDGRVPASLDALHGDPEISTEIPGAVDTREAIIDAFLSHPGTAVLVANPASCSESISLHRSCHNAIYLDRTYDCALYLQSIDRIHRLGLPADAAITIHILMATVNGKATIDGLVDESLNQKSARMRELLEGAEIAPIRLADSAALDAEGDLRDLSALLRFLIGEIAKNHG